MLTKTTRKAGQILVSLGYTPATETLKVMILRARNLVEVNKEGEPPSSLNNIFLIIGYLYKLLIVIDLEL